MLHRYVSSVMSMVAEPPLDALVLGRCLAARGNEEAKAKLLERQSACVVDLSGLLSSGDARFFFYPSSRQFVTLYLRLLIQVLFDLLSPLFFVPLASEVKQALKRATTVDKPWAEQHPTTLLYQL